MFIFSQKRLGLLVLLWGYLLQQIFPFMVRSSVFYFFESGFFRFFKHFLSSRTMAQISGLSRTLQFEWLYTGHSGYFFDISAFLYFPTKTISVSIFLHQSKLVERYFSDYLRVKVWDNILIPMFCQEFIIVMRFHMVLKEIQKNS